MNAIGVEFVPIKIFINDIATLQGYFIFAGVPPHNYGNIFLHSSVIRLCVQKKSKVKKKRAVFAIFVGTIIYHEKFS